LLDRSEKRIRIKMDDGAQKKLRRKNAECRNEISGYAGSWFCHSSFLISFPFGPFRNGDKDGDEFVGFR
jgi:hypothetical protein